MSSRAALLFLAVLAIPWWGCKGNENDGSVLVSVTDRASVSALGVEGNDSGSSPSISADGRYVAFHTAATNLIPGGTSGIFHVYRKDMLTGTIVLVSVSTAGVLGNGGSLNPSISADGRYIAFQSVADNLLGPGIDGNLRSDIFVRDLQAGTTIRVSVISGTGAESILSFSGGIDPVISADGTFVAFRSDATDLVSSPTLTLGVFNIFRHSNAALGTTDLVSVNTTGPEPDDSSGAPSLSSDGRYVAFHSLATNIGAAPTTPFRQHVYVRDMTAIAPQIVSASALGAEGDDNSGNPSISGDGTRIAFDSMATNLAPDSNLTQPDIFVRIVGGATTLVSRNSAGVQAIGSCRLPCLSSDGRFVAYKSAAANLVPGDTNGKNDIFWHDTVTGATLRVSVGTYGAQANDDSGILSRPVVSSDGRFVAFESSAYNLVAADGNNSPDVFWHGPMY